MNRQVRSVASRGDQLKWAVDACPANEHLRQQAAASDLDAFPDIYREDSGLLAVGLHLNDVIGALREVGGHERAVIVADSEFLDHRIASFMVMLDILCEIADHGKGVDAFAMIVEASHVALAFSGILDADPEIAGIVLAVHGVPP